MSRASRLDRRQGLTGQASARRSPNQARQIRRRQGLAGWASRLDSRVQGFWQASCQGLVCRRQGLANGPGNPWRVKPCHLTTPFSLFPCLLGCQALAHELLRFDLPIPALQPLPRGYLSAISLALEARPDFCAERFQIFNLHTCKAKGNPY